MVAFGIPGAVVGLVGFGALADTYEEFGSGAIAVFPPVAVAVLFFLLPETEDRDLEDCDDA